MFAEEKNGNTILHGVADFNVEQIFECGQCFHFEKLDEMDYVTVAYGKALRITQMDDEVTLHNTDINEYNLIWRKYLDMDTDYGSIKKWLLERDDSLVNVIDKTSGIRILRQEFHEMLMSFIISQNKQIPHIKQIVASISERFGKEAGVINGKKYFAFPEKEALYDITEEAYRELKTGFRAPYLMSATRALMEGMSEKGFESFTYQEAKAELMKIKGVGEKVANCVLLFGLGYRNAFPVDVWIKRIMEYVYFKEETSNEKIMEFANDKFGEYGGYAQQYLFHYARVNKLSL